jgi:hypothetical protein
VNPAWKLFVPVMFVPGPFGPHISARNFFEVGSIRICGMTLFVKASRIAVPCPVSLEVQGS